MLDETGRYDSPEYTDVEFQPDYNVSYLAQFELKKIISQFSLISNFLIFEVTPSVAPPHNLGTMLCTDYIKYSKSVKLVSPFIGRKSSCSIS